MKNIAVLDESTIDKIAAGEVIERPSSVVKELVENAIDAGATAITAEIKDGGISLIRITDNGEGIAKDQIATAFLRHATSKITKVEDLLSVSSLGFRGEALSSIAAVCQVEVITKTAGTLLGTRYRIEGGQEILTEEIGAPEGTTFLVNNIFYNTPARKKFLKSAMTEAGYISELMERMALSHPEIAFKFINNRQTRLHTSGNHNLKDIIYGIYGRDIAANLLPVKTEGTFGRLEGFVGKPVISRGNRNFENYFVNGRYVKSKIITKAIEDAYKTFMMQHKYPFTALHFTIPGDLLDVNVHPTKLELRFSNQEEIYQIVYDTIRQALSSRELIPDVGVDRESKKAELPKYKKPAQVPEPFQIPRTKTQPFAAAQVIRERASSYGNLHTAASDPAAVHASRQMAVSTQVAVSTQDQTKAELPKTAKALRPLPQMFQKPEDKENTDPVSESVPETEKGEVPETAEKLEKPFEQEITREIQKAEQMELFDDKLLSQQNVKQHTIIGQVFDTYWIVQFQDKMYLIDQHAAHEKVLYEQTMKRLKDHTFTSQRISPPVILTLSLKEEEALKTHLDVFEKLGFEIEPFGGMEYALSAIPDNLFGITERSLFLEILDDLVDQSVKGTPQSVLEKVASMSCKAAVKGNHRMSTKEAHALIDELLTLENPYNCPHGRPTIISMSKYELEKKFKRIV
ncbi:MAG: DNA mismatch repair endonuclease MutL [Lachnospiraceae bacterium]